MLTQKQTANIIQVTRIEIQQDELKPLPPDKLTLELLSPKRAIAALNVQENGDMTKLTAVVEYRGDALILTRTEGNCNVEQVARTLAADYLNRYGKQGLKILDNRKDGKVCRCTLTDPDHFHKFLHLLHNVGGLEYGNNREIALSPPEPILSREDRIQLADRVYTPLLKEVNNWNDPLMGRFSEWTTLAQEQRMWVMKVPKQIAILLNESRNMFLLRGKLWGVLEGLIQEAINLFAPTILGIAKAADYTNFDFRITPEIGTYISFYISWLWVSEKDLSNYIKDIVESRFHPGTQWGLETWAANRQGGTVVSLGYDRKTRQFLNKVLGYLMTKSEAGELVQLNKQIKTNGYEIRDLIDAELVK